MSPSRDPEEAVTVAIAAHRLGVDQSTVRAMVRAGEILGFRVGKGSQPNGVRIEAESIRDYKRRHRIVPPVPGARNEGRSRASKENEEILARLRALGSRL